MLALFRRHSTVCRQRPYEFIKNILADRKARYLIFVQLHEQVAEERSEDAIGVQKDTFSRVDHTSGRPSSSSSSLRS